MASLRRATGLAIWLAALAALAGCQYSAHSSTSEADGSITFEIPDAALDAPDAPTDGGDGTCGETSSFLGPGALPETCLPRCHAETFVMLAQACSSDPDPTPCVQRITRMDDTPSARLRTSGQVIEISCGGGDSVYACWAWQTYSCEADVCPTEYSDWATCAATGAPCTTEHDTLVSCAHGVPTFQPCVDSRVRACFVLGP